MSAGHSVAHAKTAQQAVFLADEHKPDVVVLEPQMARHNGIEFLYEFKSYPEWQRIPVILLTRQRVDVLEKMSVLGKELSVVQVLAKSDTTTTRLCQVIAAVGLPKK